jgi:hypothetical protein
MEKVVRMPNVPEVLPLVKALYKKNPVGCCLHIVLDDGNIHNDDVDFCIDWAIKQDHPECLKLAYLLRNMSRTQRNKLAGMNHFPLSGI